MTINNLKKFVDSLWDWGFLRNSLGGHMAPTDIDGMIERNGKFLVLEGKGSNVDIPKGQKILFERLLDLGVFTIIIIWGKPQTPEKMLIATRDGERFVSPASIADIQKVVLTWYIDACNNKQDGWKETTNGRFSNKEQR